MGGPGNGVGFTRSSRSPCHIRTACNRPEGDPRPTRWLELKVAWYREALDAPILSRLSRDMPKILLRIAIVLGLLVSTARAKVIIQVDLETQQMTVTKNNGETHVWKVSSGRSGFETPTGLFKVQRLDGNHFSDEYDQSPMPYSIFIQSSFTRAWPYTAHIRAVSDAPCHMVASAWRFRMRECSIPGSSNMGPR